MSESPKVRCVDVDVFYGKNKAIDQVSLDIEANTVMAFIGPSGCGKSTLLRAINRMNDTIPICRVGGRIELDGENVYDADQDVSRLRQRVGMVFQKSNPFPMTVYDNVAYGLRVGGMKKGSELDGRVQKALEGAALWGEVKDRLGDSALGLSGGQQQRLCIARALAVEPEVLLMDEPASALDPLSTKKIEELIGELRERFTVVIVTHNMQQAVRVSDQTAFFYLGELIEAGPTEKVFEDPDEERTRDYVTGKFG